MALVTITAAGQEWTSEQVPADGLKGIEAHTLYTYRIDSTCYVQIKDSGDYWLLYHKVRENMFTIKMKLFSRNVREMRSKCSAVFLDMEGAIVERMLEDVQVTATFRAKAIGSGRYTCKDAAMIPKFLRESTGTVRIIAPMQFGGDTDITIPCLNNPK